MDNKNNKQAKKPYQKPEVIYSKKIEVISTTCNTARGNFSGCMKTSPPCIKRPGSRNYGWPETLLPCT